jgi:ASC-1-like (ASCH) protein
MQWINQKTLKIHVFNLKTYLTFELISVDAIFDQVNAVNETLTSDFETLQNDMDAMELKHEQAIGKSTYL